MMPESVDLTPVRGCHILVALSGGADSIALLMLLVNARERFQLRVTAAHFNHMIRGGEADRDEEFCRQTCARLGVNLIRGRADIPAIARENGIGIETCAREERYHFLRAAKEKCGAGLIALAHHADDQVETILMHLLRGTGPSGICGMPCLGGDLFRPLLDCSKAEIIKWLQSKNIEWCEDRTNLIPDNPRNALRLKALPELELIYPSFRNAVLRFSRSARIENDFLEQLSREHRAKHVEYYPIGARLDLKTNCPDAILRRTIRALCGSALTYDKLEEILYLARASSGRVELTGDLAIERTGSALWFINTRYTQPDPVQINGNELCLEDIAMLRITPGRFPIVPDDPMTESIDLEPLRGACLRTRRPGDRMRPLGMKGTRLLSDCLTDKKLERPLRDCLPLIAIDDRVLWCFGLGISEEVKITADTRSPGRIDIQLFQYGGKL